MTGGTNKEHKVWWLTNSFYFQEEDADDFYKTAYGGFSDLESDHEYRTENDQSDVVDTDFDHTEASDNQAVVSDHDFLCWINIF